MKRKRAALALLLLLLLLLTFTLPAAAKYRLSKTVIIPLAYARAGAFVCVG